MSHGVCGENQQGFAVRVSPEGQLWSSGFLPGDQHSEVGLSRSACALFRLWVLLGALLSGGTPVCPHASPTPGGLTNERCIFHSRCAPARPVAALGHQGPGTDRGVGASWHVARCSAAPVSPPRATSLPRPRDWAVPQSPRLQGRECGGRAAGAWEQQERPREPRAAAASLPAPAGADMT